MPDLQMGIECKLIYVTSLYSASGSFHLYLANSNYLISIKIRAP